MTIEGSSVQVGGSLEKSQENSGTLEILPQGKVEVMLFAQRREEYTEGRNYKFSNLFNFKKKVILRRMVINFSTFATGSKTPAQLICKRRTGVVCHCPVLFQGT